MPRVKDSYSGTPEIEEPETPTVRSQLPAVIPPASSVAEWPNRPLPNAVGWQPRVPTTWLGRRAAKRLVRGFELSREVIDAATRVYEAAARLEQARQSLEYVHAVRSLLPLRLVHERLLLEQELGKALIDLEAVRGDLENQRASRVRRRLLTQEDFRLEVLRRDAERRELEARITSASAQSTYAARVGARRGEADLHRAQESTFRAQSSAERERGRLEEERERHRHGRSGSDDGMPEPLRRYYATEREVNENVAEAHRRAQAIRDRAARERRDLSEQEIEEIDALEDAARAAEGSIRRGAASDVGV